MATEGEDTGEDVLDLTDVVQDDADGDEGQDEGEQSGDGEPDGEDGEPVVLFGDEPVDGEPAEEPDLVKHLRRELRDRERRLAQAAKAPAQQEADIVVGERPKIEDFDYDTEAHDKALDEYEARKDAKREQDERRAKAKRDSEAAWEKVKTTYATKKAALPFADKDRVEAAAFEALPAMHQAVIAKVATDPALFIYAAGKSPARLDQLAAIDDPLVLAATIGKMGATLTMKKRSTAPQPEKIARGGVVQQGTDKTLARLEAAAEKSGDRTELQRYKRQQAAKAGAR